MTLASTAAKHSNGKGASAASMTYLTTTNSQAKSRKHCKFNNKSNGTTSKEKSNHRHRKLEDQERKILTTKYLDTIESVEVGTVAPNHPILKS